MRAIALILSCLAALTLAPAVQAQGVSAEDMRAAEDSVAMRDYYPEGYYDVRVAAEATIAKWPRERDEMLDYCESGSDYGRASAYGNAQGAGSGRCYEVMDCAWQPVPANDDDPAYTRFGAVALEIARLRSELDRLGYPTGVYARPIDEFERRMVESGTALEGEAADDARKDLVDTLERRRSRLAPQTLSIVNDAPCDPLPDGPIIVRTVPTGGEVLLINAFSFNVCTRRQPDPWDRFACRWNEWVPGEMRTQPYGRFMYQVTWPDGTNRRGSREIVRDAGEESVTVTFRK